MGNTAEEKAVGENIEEAEARGTEASEEDCKEAIDRVAWLLEGGAEEGAEEAFNAEEALSTICMAAQESITFSAQDLRELLQLMGLGHIWTEAALIQKELGDGDIEREEDLQHDDPELDDIESDDGEN